MFKFHTEILFLIILASDHAQFDNDLVPNV